MAAPKTLVTATLSLAALATCLGTITEAEGMRVPPGLDPIVERPGEFGFGVAVAQFRLDDLPLGGQHKPTLAPHAGSHGGTLSVDADGVLVLDRESGKLLRTDRAGTVLASLAFQPGPGEMVSDGSGSTFVADRRANKVVHVRSEGASLSVVGSSKLREPHGLALSPNGKTLYVTSVADHLLVALDTETLLERWRVELAVEPRAVAVSPDGSRALVGFLSSGVVANVELGTTPNVSYLTLDPAQRIGANDAMGMGSFGFGFGEQAPGNVDAAVGGQVSSLADIKDIGLRFARNTYAIAYVGDGLAIAPHQLSSPHLPSAGFEDAGTYGGGGGFLAPITHRMAMIDAEDSFAPSIALAEIGLHQPRALTYDASTDTLYMAGYGNDMIMAVADVSQASIHMTWSAGMSVADCGPDGLAVDGQQLLVHCELGRRLVSMDLAMAERSGSPSSTLLGDVLGASPRSHDAQRGAELFRRGQDPRLSSGGFMACASCHPEGRTDGLSWRIEGHNLQTPLLAGRLLGTHPFKWDGKDRDLPTSLTNTIGRLGGMGLAPADIRALEAFLQSLPSPQTPTITNADAVARGQQLFESEQTGCIACHDGPRLADGTQHDLHTNIGAVDTPSLIGLAHSAPYYHDGSARTLRALLTDKGSIHDMGNSAQLDAAQLDDLIAYLESL